VIWQPHPSAMHWSWMYLSSTVVAASGTLLWTVRQLGRPRLALWRLRNEWVEGFYFSISQSSQSIYNDIDKVMLTRLAMLDAAGIYAAAYRLVDVACTPFKSLLAAAFPGFFRAGSAGVVGTIRYMRKLLYRAVGYALVASVTLIVLAPVVPRVLGTEYVHVVEALRWLAALPVLRAVHYFLADALTGAGHQGMRSVVQFFVAVVNVALNLWIIPAYSWRGAAWSSIACDAVLATAMGLALYVRAKGSQRDFLIGDAVGSRTA
jgi:O-antigen/teichoic acid export membrane protein